MINVHSRIFFSGHSGMVGNAIVRRLQEAGYANVVTRGWAGLDLLGERTVHAFLPEQRPENILIAAPKIVVGPIQSPEAASK